MYSVLLVVHVMITLALIGIILVQRSSSEGAVLSSSSSTSFMSGRQAASFITRLTAALAAAFILTSLGLGILTARSHTGGSILDRIENSKPAPLSAQEPLTPKPGAQPSAAAPSAPPSATPQPQPAKTAVPRPE